MKKSKIDISLHYSFKIFEEMFSDVDHFNFDQSYKKLDDIILDLAGNVYIDYNMHKSGGIGIVPPLIDVLSEAVELLKKFKKEIDSIAEMTIKLGINPIKL